VMDAPVKRCGHCDEPVSENQRGRPQRFCKDSCRQAHRKTTSTPGRRMERHDFLEISPFQSDEGEQIGKHPNEVPSQTLCLKFRAQNPLKAIREKCLDCCCGNAAEVRKCVAVDCPMWPFRMDTNPFRKKRELTPEQKRQRTERLVKAQTRR
jgi:hypothetical protein